MISRCCKCTEDFLQLITTISLSHKVKALEYISQQSIRMLITITQILLTRQHLITVYQHKWFLWTLQNGHKQRSYNTEQKDTLVTSVNLWMACHLKKKSGEVHLSIQGVPTNRCVCCCCLNRQTDNRKGILMCWSAYSGGTTKIYLLEICQYPLLLNTQSTKTYWQFWSKVVFFYWPYVA